MSETKSNKNSKRQNPTLKVSGGISRTAIRRTRSRILGVVICFSILFTIVAARLVMLTFWERSTPLVNAKVIDLAEDQSIARAIAKKDRPSQRGDIYDRNGVLLATSLKTSSVYADPKFIQDPVETAKKLSETLPGVDYGKLLKRLQSKRRFIWIERHLTPEQLYNVNSLGLPGVHFLPEEKRVYPNGDLASHAIGYTNVDNLGVMGIERSFEDLLSKHNQDIKISIDSRIQNALERETQSAIDKFSAKGAAGVVLDVNSGEIMAMVSMPTFDPHKPSKTAQINQYNRATMGVYELGSIFKVFTITAALENSGANPTTIYKTRKPLKRAGFTIEDFHSMKRNLNLAEILVHSSNIGSALVAESVGTEGMLRLFGDLGILDPVDLEINETGKPLIPYPWREINTLTSSYGHGLAVSPLQAAAALAAVVNGGHYIRPTLMALNEEQRQELYRGRVVSQETSQHINHMLRLAVTEGTGSKADVPGLRVGGKTGTAEKPGGKDGGYKHDALISSFVGVFPMDNPQYLVLVAVDEPNGIKDTYGYATGGWVSAPIAQQVIKEIGALYDIPKRSDHEKLREVRQRYNVKAKHRKTNLASF